MGTTKGGGHRATPWVGAPLAFQYYDPASLHCGATPAVPRITSPRLCGVVSACPPRRKKFRGESDMNDDGFHGEQRGGDGCKEDWRDGGTSKGGRNQKGDVF